MHLGGILRERLVEVRVHGHTLPVCHANTASGTSILIACGRVAAGARILALGVPRVGGTLTPARHCWLQLSRAGRGEQVKGWFPLLDEALSLALYRRTHNLLNHAWVPIENTWSNVSVSV